MSNFVSKTKKKLIRKKKLCRPTVPNFFGNVSGNKEHFFLRLSSLSSINHRGEILATSGARTTDPQIRSLALHHLS